MPEREYEYINELSTRFESSASPKQTYELFRVIEAAQEEQQDQLSAFLSEPMNAKLLNSYLMNLDRLQVLGARFDVDKPCSIPKPPSPGPQPTISIFSNTFKNLSVVEISDFFNPVQDEKDEQSQPQPGPLRLPRLD